MIWITWGLELVVALHAAVALMAMGRASRREHHREP